CFIQAKDGIRARNVTVVQTCALPILADIRIAALPGFGPATALAGAVPRNLEGKSGRRCSLLAWQQEESRRSAGVGKPSRNLVDEIGRASCRERVKIAVVAQDVTQGFA